MGSIVDAGNLKFWENYPEVVLKRNIIAVKCVYKKGRFLAPLTGYERAFMNTQKIQLGQHPIFKIPVRSEAFMNWFKMGIHDQFMNTSNLIGTWKIGCWPSGIFWVFMNARSYPVHERL